MKPSLSDASTDAPGDADNRETILVGTEADYNSAELLVLQLVVAAGAGDGGSSAYPVDGGCCKGADVSVLQSPLGAGDGGSSASPVDGGCCKGADASVLQPPLGGGVGDLGAKLDDDAEAVVAGKTKRP